MPSPDALAAPTRATIGLPFAAPAQVEFPAGLTIDQALALAEAAGDLDPGYRPFLRVWAGDQEVPAALWARARPRPGVILAVRATPQGGDGGGGEKNPLRVVLELALLVAVAWIGGPGAAGAFSWAGRFARVAQFAAATAVAVAGRMLINAVAPMPQPRYAGALSAYDIQGARNVMDPFGSVGCVLGTHRVFPKLAAKTYTETVGDDVYLRMLVCWGVGPVSVTDLKIGDTPLASYVGVEVQHRLAPADPWPTLFPQAPDEDPVGAQLLSGVWNTRNTIALDADELCCDIVMPEGLGFNGDEGIKAHQVQIRARYRAVGSSTWLGFSSGVAAPNGDVFTWVGSTTRPQRRTIRRLVARGEYEVALQRVTADRETEPPVLDQTWWGALRTFTGVAPVADADLSITALRIKASEQLQGVIDTLNGLVTRLAPTWNGAAFTGSNPTSNPGDLFRWIAAGPGAARPLAGGELDDAGLGAWRAQCAAKGWTCDHWINDAIGWDEALQLVAACGRARPIRLPNGKISVVVDDVQPAAVQMFTPRNSWGFRSTLRFPPDTHALRVEYANAARGYQADEVIVYFPGYTAANAELIESLSAIGKTDAVQAARYGHRAIAETLLRRETYVFNADIESLVASKGKRVAIAHHAIVVGRRAARVTALTTSGGNVTAVTLDEDIEQTVGGSYGLKWRADTGAVSSLAVTTVAGISRTLALAAPPAIASAPKVGDLVQFGDAGIETLDAIILDIRPKPHLTAEITAVPYAQPAIGAEDSTTLPAWTSNVSGDVFPAPPAPIIVDVTANVDAIAVTFDFPADQAQRVAWIEGAWRLTPDAGADVPWEPIAPLPKEARLALFPPGQAGRTYQIRLIAAGGLNQRSAPATQTGIAAFAAAGGASVGNAANACIDTSFKNIAAYWTETYTNAGLPNTHAVVSVSGVPTLRGTLTGTPAAGKQFNVGQLGPGPVALQNLPVLPGDRIEASAYVAMSGCAHAHVYLNWYNEAGVYQGSIQCGPVTTTPSGGGVGLAAFTRIGGFATAPASARFVAMGVQGTTNGAANPTLDAAAPFLAKASNAATALTPYQQGPDQPPPGASTFDQAAAPAGAAIGDLWRDSDDPQRRVYRWDGSSWVVIADQTAFNTAAAIAGQGALATRNDVATTHVQANAISQVSAATTTGIAADGGYTTMQTVTLTTTGGPVLVAWSVLSVLGNDPGGYSLRSLRIQRDGSTIYEAGNCHTNRDGIGYDDAALLSGQIVDAPAAGARTYTVQTASGGVAVSRVEVSQRTLSATELKR